MAFTRFHNIDGSSNSTVELIKPGSQVDNIESILITNTHATATATVTLFIQDNPTSGTALTFKILSTVAIPSDTSLLLNDSSIFRFRNKTSDSFGLYITVGGSDTLDVLINTGIL